jgi:hypothetical protein
MPKKRKLQTKAVYVRLGVLRIDEVLPFIPLDKNSDLPRKRIFFGVEVRMTSPRYPVYAKYGVKCAHCELEGLFFAVEKSFAQNTDKYHLNLYGINKYGEEVMITVDHIRPKSKGGEDNLDNKQPLCIFCNGKKGDKIPEDISED